MIQRVRGTRDFRPEEMWKRNWLSETLRKIARSYGYREVLTPVIETAELFVTKSGPGVLNEMYSFTDKGGRELSLRPELTAPIIRFFVNDLRDEPLPIKLFSISNCFRYEEPQLGRYREFFHFDVEIIGSDDPDADAELLSMSNSICRSLGLREYSYRIGHVGIVRERLDRAGVDRQKQSEFLHLIDKKRLKEAEELLASSGTRTADVNDIMHICSLKGDVSLLSGLGSAAEQLHETVRIAEACGLGDHTIDLGVVRGLDYYTGMVFEIDYPSLGAEKQICGGGAYRLSHLFGGPDVPCTGFAFGFDRLLIAAEKQTAPPPEPVPDALIIPLPPVDRAYAAALSQELRASGLSVETDLMNRTLSKALKYASSRGARFAVIIGEKEMKEGIVLLRNMSTGEQKGLERERLASAIRA